MRPTTRLILFPALILLCYGSALAQQPGPQFWRKVGCEPFEARTFLEGLEETRDLVIIKGFTRITTVEVRGVRIDAVHMRELNNQRPSAKGIVISLREGDERRHEDRAFVDYDQIDRLLAAIDAVSRVDETSTRFPGFEATYKTSGDFEIRVFRQTQRGTAVILSTGICDPARQTMT
ncbi:MAG TPA: hypothetical protein VFO99_01350, partial [Pyrinomonadaceae bacterium]|nr:hypothetical protein [Pyrinomonadaceae bacterium]